MNGISAGDLVYSGEKLSLIGIWFWRNEGEKNIGCFLFWCGIFL